MQLTHTPHQTYLEYGCCYYRSQARMAKDGRRQPVRLAIDASSAQLGGGITYLEQLLPRLAARDDIRITALLVRTSTGAQSWISAAEKVTPAQNRIATLRSSWFKSVRRGADVLYAPTEIAFGPRDVPLVLALRNALYDPRMRFEFPRRRKLRMGAMQSLARLSALRADRHIAVSNYIASVGSRYLKVPTSRISVVYHGGPTRDPQPSDARQDSILNPPRFLFVSNISSPHKNLHRLLEALHGVDGVWSLDIAGDIGDHDYKQLIERLVHTFKPPKRVRLLGHCDRETLDTLYARANWFVWPSYGEAFGHPLIEASSAGLRLVAAESSSVREIAGDSPVYFDPFNIGDIRGVLESIVTGATQRPPLQLPRLYSWDKCAAETAAVLRDAVGITDLR